MRATTLIAAILSLGAARPERVGPVELFWPDARAADSSALIDTDIDRYQRVRWRVRVGRFAQAISEIDAVDASGAQDLFLDRYALLRAQAWQGLGKPALAKEDFLRAIYASQTPAVNEAAVRGLIAVTKKLGQKNEERAYLDALIGRPGTELEPALLLQRIDVLIALGEFNLARERVWELVDIFPDQSTVDTALRSLARIERRRSLHSAERVRVGIARAKYDARNHRYGRATNQLKSLRRAAKSNELILAVELELAGVLREKEARSQAEQVLSALLEQPRFQGARPQILLRLAHLSQDRYQYRRARELYDEIIADFPGTQEARTAAHDAIQLEYDAREYAAASDRAIRATRTSELSTDTLWLAGWSSYLAGRYLVADDYFRGILRDKSADIDPELRDASEYWLIRSAEEAGRRDEALWSYRALATKKPIEYYGLLAQARLEHLGEASPGLSPAIVPPPANIEEVVALLGPDRPVGVDRAIKLLRSGLRTEGAEELLAVLDHYRRTGHLLGATLTIELFCLFERDAWVFLLARNVAEGEEGARLDRRPEFWRILHYAYPTLFESEVGAASRKHEIDPLLVYAVMRTESLFRPDAVSPVGARGLMQLMPYTARWIGRTIGRATPEARRHAGRYRAPESNVWLGAWYMKSLLSRYQGNVVRALGAYNAGPGAMDRWVRDHSDLEADEIAERTPYDETRRYVRRALTSYLMYRKLYGGGSMSLMSREKSGRAQGS